MNTEPQTAPNPNIMRSGRIVGTLLLTLSVGIIAPLAGTFFLGKTMPDWLRISLPFHSTIEVTGAVFGLLLAGIIMHAHQRECTLRKVMVAYALTIMGVLDIFHGCVTEGNLFVWLHSLAVLLGGLFFAASGLPDRPVARRKAALGALLLALCCIQIGVISLNFPELIPAMQKQESFTRTASFLNITGGWLTLAGGLTFAVLYYRHHALENLSFLLLCCLLGSSTIIFSYASIWEAGWWFWHLIRFAGYLAPFSLAIYTYGQMENQFELEQIKLATALANGDYNAQIVPRDKDDELGIALQSMAHSLQASRSREEKQQWLQSRLAGLEHVMRTQKNLPDLCRHVTEYLADTLDARIGSLSIADSQRQELALASCYACRVDPDRPQTFAFGEGLAGQVAQEKKRIHITDVPENYLTVTSALGKTAPAEIICQPLILADEVVGVVEFGTLEKFTDLHLQFLNQCTERISIAIHTGRSDDRIQMLLEESQAQTEELKSQQDELQKHNKAFLRQQKPDEPT